MDDPTTMDAASLSHLSSQLQSLGFLSRPLDVASLFSAAAPTPTTAKGGTNDDPASILAHQATMQQQYRAREQVLRCLWSLLTARNDAAEGLEAVSARERVLAYEIERTKAMLKREREAREASERDKQNERAKAQSATAALTTEQTRHRHAREELVKARSALQFVRTQAQLDQKRRDATVSTMMARLQRLTADPAQTKFVVANAKLANVHPVVASAVAGGPSGRMASAARSGPRSSRVDDRSSEEVVYWQSALEDCESERSRLALENEQLRELVGEVGEWAELMLDTDTVNNKEAQEIGDGFAADTSLSVPSPHLALTVAELATPLHNKLYQIRCGVAALVAGVEDRLEAAQTKLANQLEREHAELQEAKKVQVDVEHELAAAREAIAQSDKLMQDFAARQLSSAAGPVVELKDVIEEEIAPVVVSPPRRTAVSQADPAPRPSIATADRFEAQRAQDVAAFLSDLGLDSPAPTGAPLESLAAKVAKLQRAPLGSTQATTATTSTSASASDRLQKVLERTRVEMSQNGQRKENTQTASRPPSQY
ncbi:BZ3500_MvSof-1268-A1-R1_Chr6-3g08874 [Microbotryum saponariae]|uniref:BZ3500_MvSof-1268-A1-R1_Chr6-3g08874 protein n=1 Tax=Microbotryum saponariae TaxID=289078 RepID=A0A2X0L4U9_9BASI|nr:BZ3500_MvSof-1268-A1-R1_Chr6-3g08874 [Microbotryum saponariae]SDA07475.1 BZ3501_MvSof-1269-A2-R1_Chr6-2g08577 [Microbotryum saponariae]